MTEILSPYAFKWFLTILTGGVAGTWFFYDAIKIWRLRGADKKDPIVRDKIFGYLIGMAVGFTGVLGCLRFHDVV